MENSKNFSTKLVLVLVIAVLALVAIIYFLQKDWLGKEAAVCGNGIVEGNECCDGDAWADDCYGACDPNKYVNRCGANCQPECIPIEVDEELSIDEENGEMISDELAAEEEEPATEEEETPVVEEPEEETPVVTDPTPSRVCGNGIAEGSELMRGSEECDGNDVADWYVGMCDPNKYIMQCNDECKMECVEKPAPVCGNFKLEEGEQCDGKMMRTYAELVELFPSKVLPVCGCGLGTKTVYTCNSDCTQNCHCE